MLKNILLAEGLLKKQTGEKKELGPEVYTCVFLDRENKELNRLYVENPLLKHIESYQNEGEMHAESIRLDSGSFNLRIPYHTSLYQLKIVHQQTPIATILLFGK